MEQDKNLSEAEQFAYEYEVDRLKKMNYYWEDPDKMYLYARQTVLNYRRFGTCIIPLMEGFAKKQVEIAAIKSHKPKTYIGRFFSSLIDAILK